MNDEFVLIWPDDIGDLIDSDGDQLIDSDGDVLEVFSTDNVAVLFSGIGQLVDSDGEQLIDSDGNTFGFAEGQTVATFTINI